MMKRVLNKITEAYEILSDKKKKAHYDYITNGKYGGVDSRKNGAKRSSYYSKARGNEGDETMKTASNPNMYGHHYGSGYSGNYYENLKNESYQQNQQNQDRNLAKELFLKVAGTIAALSMLRSFLYADKKDTAQSVTRPQQFAPFATTGKINDEAMPYNAFMTPGGETHSPARPKMEVKKVKVSKEQYVDTKKGSIHKPYTNQIPVMIPKEVQKQRKKPKNSFKISEGNPKKLKKGKKKKGPKFVKKEKSDSEEEVPQYVPIVGPVALKPSDRRVKIVGSISNMRHERQQAGYKIVKD